MLGQPTGKLVFAMSYHIEVSPLGALLAVTQPSLCVRSAGHSAPLAHLRPERPIFAERAMAGAVLGKRTYL